MISNSTLSTIFSKCTKTMAGNIVTFREAHCKDNILQRQYTTTIHTAKTIYTITLPVAAAFYETLWMSGSARGLSVTSVPLAAGGLDASSGEVAEDELGKGEAKFFS